MIFDYTTVGLFFAINLTIYFLISLPLDYFTYFRKNSERKRRNSQDLDITFTMIITFLVSAYMWLIFLLVPLDVLVGLNIFNDQLLSAFEPFATVIQVLGFGIVIIATLIASWGRISRGNRAFSWGIPKKLEKEGMYRYIRHPLYASYCYYFLGFSMILQHILILPLLFGIYGYYDLSNYEESILVDHFGEEYLQYRETVGRFFPRLQKKD
ncbi:MAG: methyltransferase family protein [Promethearchaeota archaeon]